jgi:hypothetical protein
VHEPDHVVIEGPELAAELYAILARFGAEAVVRAVRGMLEGRCPAPEGPPPPPGAVRCGHSVARERTP